jgi:hypothetical protein
MAKTTEKTYIRLDYTRDGSVLVTPSEQDRFVVSIQQAISACSNAETTLKYFRQFTEVLVPKLKEWLKARRPKVQRAFLTYRDGGLLLLVVRKQTPLDGEFTDELTKLDVEIANDPNLDLIRLDVLALPNVPDESVKSFLSPDRQRELADA